MSRASTRIRKTERYEGVESIGFFTHVDRDLLMKVDAARGRAQPAHERAAAAGAGHRRPCAGRRGDLAHAGRAWLDGAGACAPGRHAPRRWTASCTAPPSASGWPIWPSRRRRWLSFEARLARLRETVGEGAEIALVHNASAFENDDRNSVTGARWQMHHAVHYETPVRMMLALARPSARPGGAAAGPERREPATSSS